MRREGGRRRVCEGYRGGGGGEAGPRGEGGGEGGKDVGR